MHKLFIHIPKTGGTSVKAVINPKYVLSSDRYKEHDPLFLLEQKYNLSNHYIFAVVRNPYTRAFSHYKHFNKINNFNYTFKEFLYIVWSGPYMSVEYLKSPDHMSFIHRTPMIFFNQCFYIKSFKKYKVDIFKFENLEKLENILQTTLPHFNKSNDSNSVEYDDETVELIQNIYSEDFLTFDYDIHSVR